jgi:hypothetical protein
MIKWINCRVCFALLISLLQAVKEERASGSNGQKETHFPMPLLDINARDSGTFFIRIIMMIACRQCKRNMPIHLNRKN